MRAIAEGMLSKGLIVVVRAHCYKFCGDGIVQGGEECDEGRDNDDGGSCTLSSSTRGEGKTAARDSRLSKLRRNCV